MKKRNNRFDRGLEGKGSTYVRELGGFHGLDCASEPSRISERRVARCLNMWRDYESENGGAIETIPGWRRLIGGLGKVNGIFGFRSSLGAEYLVLHIGKNLYRIPVSKLDSLTSLSGYLTGTVSDAPSVFFESGGYCYLLDGSDYYRLGASGGHKEIHGLAYVPVTYLNGEPYQQRNMLTADFIERNTVDLNASKAYSVEPCWKYELVGSGESGYLKLVGIADGYDARDLAYAYLPKTAYLGGIEYPVMDFDPDFFDLLPYTVQLVVDAPLSFFGLSGSVLRGRHSGSISGMELLQRLVLRNDGAKYEFNACDHYDDSGSSPVAVPVTPLRELWIAGSNFGGFGKPSIPHEYSDPSVGITSAYHDKVTLYVATANETWGGEVPSNTVTVNGVVFTEERTGGSLTLRGVKRAELKSSGGATMEFSAAREECTVFFDPCIAYSHLHLEAEGKTYCVLIRDADTGLTCEENGKWLEYVVYEPLKRVKTITVDGVSVSRYVENASAGKVAVFLPLSSNGGELDIRCEGYSNKFSALDNFSTVYDNGFSSATDAWEAINKCTVVCAYDGRVFFTGNPALPNTVFYSGRGLNGENDPTYIGIYNYFNDGIGNVKNTAMVASASMLAVLKGDISTDACAYYHVAQYNSDKDTADLLPRIYPSTEGVSNIPCVGAACNFADDIVFLSSKGLEGVEKQSLNLERTLSHRSGRVDPVLRKALSSSSRMAEWLGYLCILNSDGTMLLADSRAVNTNEATGEAQYEWFMLEGVGSYSDDSAKWEYGSGTVALTDVEGNAAELPIEELSVVYGGTEYPVRIGAGEVSDGAEVISFGTVCGADGAEYGVPDGLNAVLVGDVFCPVEESEERVGGTFRPATALFEFRGKLYFGTGNGDLCVFNTDKREISYDQGEVAGVIGSRWYDRCGHRYESGFATISDDCGYPQFAKSTVGKTLTLRAKRMPRSAFTLSVRSEREDWRRVEAFTATDDFSFCDVDFANFSFENNERGIYSSSEKLKRWGEKQMYFYSDGFRQPFGIYGISYCYCFAGRRR